MRMVNSSLITTSLLLFTVTELCIIPLGRENQQIQTPTNAVSYNMGPFCDQTWCMRKPASNSVFFHLLSGGGSHTWFDPGKTLLVV